MNYLRAITLFSFILYTLNSSAQEISTEIHGKKMKTFADIEKKLHGKLYQGEGDIIIPGGMATPLTYRRTEKDIPDLLITYTFSQGDSLMNSIEYEWDVINFDKNKMKQPLGKQKAFIKKYQLLVDQLNQKYGKSEQEGDLSDLTKIELKGGLKRNDKWKPNDSSVVYMYTVLSNYEEENENFKIGATNRIRLYVNNVKKTPGSELTEKTIQAAKKCYDQFIVKLRAGDLPAAQSLLSPQIRSQMNETVFNQLRADIKPEPFRVYTQNLQEVNGVKYLRIQYAYASAPENPKEVVRVFFDKENLIIGIVPLKEKVN